MRRAGHRTLLLRPLQRVQPQRWPMVLRHAAGKHLLLETEQYEMSALVRAKATHLDVVAQQVRILRNLVDGAAEKLLLKIEARSPRKVGANLQILAFAMAKHVL